MSEAYSEKNPIKNFFSKFIPELDKKETSIKSNYDDGTYNIISGSYNRIDDIINKLIDISINSRMELIGCINFAQSIDIVQYLDIMSKTDMFQYGNNVTTLINSINGFNFKFIDYTVDEIINKYCIISIDEENEVLAIFKTTSNNQQYELLNEFLYLLEDDNLLEIEDSLENFIYSHVCGIILSYVKLNISRFELPEDGKTYLVKQWPEESEIILLSDWIK